MPLAKRGRWKRQKALLGQKRERGGQGLQYSSTQRRPSAVDGKGGAWLETDRTLSATSAFCPWNSAMACELVLLLTGTRGGMPYTLWITSGVTDAGSPPWRRWR